MGAGATLATLAATVSKSFVCNEHECAEKVNKALLWTGLSVAGGGVALLAMSRRNDSVRTEIVIDPRWVMVQHRLTFNGIARNRR